MFVTSPVYGLGNPLYLPPKPICRCCHPLTRVATIRPQAASVSSLSKHDRDVLNLLRVDSILPLYSVVLVPSTFPLIVFYVPPAPNTL